MQDKIRVSIIIPVYNVEQYLAECLDSVLQQDFEEMEILCVDDCSTDCSRDLLEQYARQDSRIHIISYASNGGLSYARNRGLERAKGKYVFFLDSDDRMGPCTLRSLVERAESTKADIVAFDAEPVYEKGIDPAQYPFSVKWKACEDSCLSGPDFFTWSIEQDTFSAPVWGYLWRMDFLRRNHLIFYEGIIHEDMVFSPKAIMLASRVVLYHEVCYIYRRRAHSIMTELDLRKHVQGVYVACQVLATFYYEHVAHWTPACRHSIERFLQMMFSDIRSAIRQIYEEMLRSKPFDDPALNLMVLEMICGRYSFMPGVMTQVLKDGLQSWESIIIYGTGKVGREILQFFEENGIRNYQLAVTKKNSQMGGLQGMTQELRNLRRQSQRALVIVAVGKKLHEEMEDEARRQGFAHVVWYEKLFRQGGITDVQGIGIGAGL